jgi:hypothetical protein
MFAFANEYQIETYGKVFTSHVVRACTGYVEDSKTDATRLTTLRSLLEQISTLYRDNAIADRSLIDRVAEFLKTEPCRMLIRSVPEVLEILYGQRTTRANFRPSAVTSTFFRPVTMDEYYRRDFDGDVSASMFARRPTAPRVPPPSRPFRDRPIKRRWPGSPRGP